MLAVIVGGIAFIGLTPTAEAAPYKHTVTAERPIFKYYVFLRGGVRHELEVRDTSGIADPVLRLFSVPKPVSPERFIGLTEVAHDDDSGIGAEPRLVIDDVGTSNIFLVVVHAHVHEFFFGGTGDLVVDGETLVDDFEFGGQWVGSGVMMREGIISKTQNRRGDRLETIFEPLGATQGQLLVVGDPGNPTLEPMRALRFSQEFLSEEREFSVGRYEHFESIRSGFRAGGYVSSETRGEISLVHNDIGRFDGDGDGIGANLEAELGSCDRPSERTKDGWNCADSLPSDTDLDGIPDQIEVFGRDAQVMRYWGADPTHKDVFVEVDRGPGFDGQLSVRADDAWAESVARVYAPGTAQEYGNPDGLDGLRLHFDVEDASDFETTEQPALLFDGGGSGATTNNAPCTPIPNHADRRLDSQVAERHELFHYVCLTADDSTGFGGDRDASIPALELYSPPNFRTVAHELGHNLGLLHGGDEPLPIGKPNYHSIMNYAFEFFVGLSHGDKLDLDPRALCESVGVGVGSPTYLGRGEPHELFVTAGGSIDWNRNGQIDGGCNARGPLLATPGAVRGSRASRNLKSHCQGAEEQPVEGTLTSHDVSVFETSSGELLYYVFYTSTPSEPGENTDGVAFSVWADRPSGLETIDGSRALQFIGEPAAVAATSRSAGIGDVMYVAVVLPGAITIYRVTVNRFGTESFTFEGNVPFSGVSDIVGVPDLGVDQNQDLVLTWRSVDGSVWITRSEDGEIWDVPQPLRMDFGQPPFSDVRRIQCDTAPSLTHDGAGVVHLVCGGESQFGAKPRGRLYEFLGATRVDVLMSRALEDVSNRVDAYWRSDFSASSLEGGWDFSEQRETPLEKSWKVHMFDRADGAWRVDNGCLSSVFFSYLDLDVRPHRGLGSDSPIAVGVGGFSEVRPDGSTDWGLGLVPYVDGVLRESLHDANDYVIIGQDTEVVDWNGPGICRAIAKVTGQPCSLRESTIGTGRGGSQFDKFPGRLGAHCLGATGTGRLPPFCPTPSAREGLAELESCDF